MTGKLNRLNVKQVSALIDPGRYADGGGLYLKVRPGGSRQWVFLYVTLRGGANGSRPRLALAARALAA
jgi:hypothetical protein